MNTIVPISKLPDRLAEAILILAGAAIIWWALPDILDWFHGDPTAPRAATKLAIAACAPPTEHEQLHIVVIERDGKLVGECMFLGARGTYRHSAR